MAETSTPTTAPAEKKRLPAIDRIFEKKADIDHAVNEARKVGYKDYALRKFDVNVAGVKRFVIAYNEGDAYGRLCESTLVKPEQCKCTEVDASPRAPRITKPLTPDTVMEALAGFSAADRERIKAALAAKKAG